MNNLYEFAFADSPAPTAKNHHYLLYVSPFHSVCCLFIGHVNKLQNVDVIPEFMRLDSNAAAASVDRT